MHAGIMWTLAHIAYPSLELQGVGDVYCFGLFVYTLLVMACSSSVAFLTDSWWDRSTRTWTIGAIFTSLGMYSIFLFVYNFFFKTSKPGSYRVVSELASKP